MNPTVIAVVVIFLVLGVMLGWFSQKTQAAHGDVKVAKTRLSGGRKTRWRSAVFALILAIALVLAIKDTLYPH